VIGEPELVPLRLRLRSGGGGPCEAALLHLWRGGEEGAHGGDGGIDEEVVRDGGWGEGFSARVGRERVLEEAEEEAAVEGHRRGVCGGG